MRLQDFALGGIDPVSKKPIRMSTDQVRAAVALLRKTLPDITNVEMSGPGGGAVVVEIVKFAGQPALPEARDP